MRRRVEGWTVDYGSGPRPVEIPHAWRQDVPVTWEGPALYRTLLDVPPQASLVFEAVSYEAEVRIDGRSVARHEGLWDAFAVDLDPWAGRSVALEVAVTKNGGPRFPVPDVASGFLPYVYHTFGGIYGEVFLAVDEPDPIRVPEARPRRQAEVGPTGVRWVDAEGRSREIGVRGLLHWGWYPELGHPRPPEELWRRELAAIAERGFDLVKFCLWVPSHRMLEVLADYDLWAWIELPFWKPSPDPERQERMADELLRIVRQYAHHDRILLWTVGCELTETTSAALRQRLVEEIVRITGNPLVKDNSGGSEMYGKDLREFGAFVDYHPYCDLTFFPPVLDCLRPDARPHPYVLLGEFADHDDYRDLGRLRRETPFWASSDPDLNDPGVRWQYDLPRVLAESRWALAPEAEQKRFLDSCRRKALFVRKTVVEAVRAREGFAGYVITGWRDTPITTSGFFDDAGESKFTPEEVLPWNSETVVFLVPARRPPFYRGGNRPGWQDPLNVFAGTAFWRVGLAGPEEDGALYRWRLRGQGREEGGEWRAMAGRRPRPLGEVVIEDLRPGDYELEVEGPRARNRWPIWAVPPFAGGFEVIGDLGDTPSEPGTGRWLSRGLPPNWRERIASGEIGVVIFEEGPVAPMPFWRECGQEFCGELWQALPMADRWERWLSLGGDLALVELDPAAEVLVRRIDTRTFAEHPLLARLAIGRGLVYFTTLRLHGGLGAQPTGLHRNPAGWWLAAHLLGLPPTKSGRRP